MSKMAELDAVFSADADLADGAKFKRFYVTYGCGSNLQAAIPFVKAQDYSSARAGVHVHTKGEFAFMYDEEGFAGQVEKYGLQRVLFQGQRPE